MPSSNLDEDQEDEDSQKHQYRKAKEAEEEIKTEGICGTMILKSIQPLTFAENTIPKTIRTTTTATRNPEKKKKNDALSHPVVSTCKQVEFLNTHPLLEEIYERPAFFGNQKVPYMTGHGVIRTMNQVFGHNGWTTQILMERLVECEQDEQGRWVVGYLARVRVSLLGNNNGGSTPICSHDDVGSGDGINANKLRAHDLALKQAVTDAMKRAARHFGERLGNALYAKGNGIKNAPTTNRHALQQLQQREQAVVIWQDDKKHHHRPTRKSYDNTARATAKENVVDARPTTTTTNHRSSPPPNAIAPPKGFVWASEMSHHNGQVVPILIPAPTDNRETNNHHRDEFLQETPDTNYGTVATPSPRRNGTYDNTRKRSYDSFQQPNDTDNKKRQRQPGASPHGRNSRQRRAIQNPYIR